jgi:hypothetical protein
MNGSGRKTVPDTAGGQLTSEPTAQAIPAPGHDYYAETLGIAA